jgi:hypothetical protein
MIVRIVRIVRVRKKERHQEFRREIIKQVIFV